MSKWRAIGSDATSGKPQELVFRAKDAATAERHAAERGMRVSELQRFYQHPWWVIVVQAILIIWATFWVIGAHESGNASSVLEGGWRYLYALPPLVVAVLFWGYWPSEPPK